MLKFFRMISVLEGLSFLAILSVTLGVLSRDYVFYLGMAHGVLFMFYLISSLLAANNQRWSLLIWAPVFFAAFIPFAFILVEMYIRRKYVIDDASAGAQT